MTDDARVRRVAEILYDELTGRKEGVKQGMEQFEPNAALAHVSAHDNMEVRQLLLDAMHLGYSVHTSMDRWGLSLRLADLVVKELEPEPEVKHRWWERRRRG